MTDEMILVPRAELLAWTKAWQSAYDPNDGTDCVTPFDLYLMKAPAEAQPCGCGEATCVEPWEPGCGLGKSEQHAEAQPAPYNRKRIAWELERTAMGDGYYGASLRAAKDFPEATPSVRSLLDRWSTGKERGLSDRIDLCAFAVKIYATDGESPQPPEAPVRCFTEEVGKDGNPTGYLLFGQSAAQAVEDRARHLLAAALRPHDRMASDWAMEPAFDGYAVAQRDALHAIAAALAQQPAAVGVPVDVVREYLDARACYEAATRPPNSHAPAPVLRHGDPVVLRLREARNDLDAALYLAHQPTPVAPVGVERLAKRIETYHWDAADKSVAAKFAAELRSLAQEHAAEVYVDFPQVGTAGPLAVVDGKVTLPDTTMNDLIRHARTGYVEQPAAVDGARFRKAPCYLCGYGGAGYFQPETHPCAALYHAAQQGGKP